MEPVIRSFVVFLCLTVGSLSHAQQQFVQTPTPISTQEATKLLRDRVPLLVRLPSYENKLEFYRKKRSEDATNATSYQRRIEQITTERDAENRLLMDSLLRGYTLQPLQFFYDRDSRALRDGTAGLLLNKDFQPIENSRVPERYLVLHVGERIGGSGQSLGGIQVLDANYQPLPFAVPSFSRRGGFGALWRSLGNRERARRKDVQRMIHRFQRKLSGYLEN